MNDQHHFLLKALAQVNNNTSKWLVIFYHPQHECVFFPLNMVQLQDSILDRLHHHTFSNMLSDKISKTHHAQILSCSNPEVGIPTPWQAFGL